MKPTSLRALTPLLILAFTTTLLADPTEDFLNAGRVRNFIRIGYVNETNPRLVYALDSYDPDEQKSLVKDLTLRTNGEVAVYIANFNPLRDSFTVNSKETPSPNFTALKAFLEDLKPFQDSFEKAPTGAGTLTTAAASTSTDDCKELAGRIKKVNDALIDEELPAEALAKHVKAASGLEGVQSAMSNLDGASKKIEKNVETVRTTIKSILADYSGVGPGGPKRQCSMIGSDVLIDYVNVTGTAAQVLTRKESLKGAIDTVVKSLDDLNDEDDWRGEDELTDYVFTRFTPTFENDRTVTVIAVRRSFKVDKGVLTVGNVDATKREVAFPVKRDSFFVAERAVAAIYNVLEYPQYGTAKNAAGETIVERSKDNHDPLNAAMMLNLVMRTPGMGSVAYPMLQIGVSTAKDFPGLLAGVGLRFTQPSAFSLSVGGMITRYKDLDGTLKPGDKVAGTAEIQSHLEYKNSPVALYGAIQIKF